MKRNKLFVVLGIAAITFASCKKDYTCKCDGGFSGQGTQVEIKKTTKSQAEETCKSYDMPNVADGYNNCRLL